MLGGFRLSGVRFQGQGTNIVELHFGAKVFVYSNCIGTRRRPTRILYGHMEP